ncbi:hypothetical protein F503_06610 [Ophiostoma piceae UAMH 11346]|uniref:Uncharacterized protein n=1 Tax=Ophiostoma piceae (strain UAMH 11346) TaxID=1262450 RepID=S3BSK1_OPHP1|nr:hypothetical protein F503_06610 [Ophiostoma piceae UAMH 11346]
MFVDLDPFRNPDPARYRLRSTFPFPPELVEGLGIFGGWWEPFEEEEEDVVAYQDSLRWKTTVSLDDMDGYKPLQMIFRLPAISPGNELNDDWYDKLMRALRHLVEGFGDRFFGAMSVAPRRTDFDSGIDANSPWGFSLPDSFVLYASDVATTDENDGGWDALLLEPVQRGSLIEGVLAKVLDEHVFADLLFGGTASQKELLSHLDSSMLDSDGYTRKLKRCEEVQRFLGDDTLTANFWDEVDRITAETAQMLMPIINLQRQILTESLRKAKLDGLETVIRAPPGICAFYQDLFDIVSVAGYASLRMARSVSIFQIDFPEVDQLWDVDQSRQDDDPVYQSSATKARAEDTKTTLAGVYDGVARQAPTRVDKIKIVTWPRIVRFKPVWSHAGDRVKSATRTFITKSHNLYYCGEAGESNTGFDGGGEDEDAHGSENDETDESLGKGHADIATSPGLLELHEHIQKAKTARRVARQRKAGGVLIRWMVNLYLLYILFTCLRAWYGAGWREVQRTLTEHATLLTEAGVSSYRFVVDVARAAPGHVVLVADQLVADVVKPALAKLPSQTTILGVMRRQA